MMRENISDIAQLAFLDVLLYWIQGFFGRNLVIITMRKIQLVIHRNQVTRGTLTSIFSLVHLGISTIMLKIFEEASPTRRGMSWNGEM